MNAIKIILVFLVLMNFINCGSKSNLIEDENEIVSLLINETYDSYFNRPKNYERKIDKSKILLDNKFVVVIDEKMKPIQSKINIKEFKSEYQLLFDELFLLKDTTTINLENLNVKKDISLVKLDDDIMKNLKQNVNYIDFHELVMFSRIAFNDEENKAILAISVSSSSLAGSYGLCFLEKEKKKWQIIGYQNISIS